MTNKVFRFSYLNGNFMGKKYDLNDYVDRNGKLKVKIIANAQSGKPATASLRQMYQDPMNAYVPKVFIRDVSLENLQKCIS